MLDRLVTQIEPLPDHLAVQTPQAFRDFLSGHSIILLGDPGAGKTHLFQHAAQHEGAEYTTVRQFVLFEGEDWQGKTVYLDALDEFRSRSDNKDTVAELVRILRRLGRPTMRLSCRVADWLGNTDLQIFRQLAQDNSFAVLRLEPLTEAQILHITQNHASSDARHFYQEAMERGLEALISNPQTLLMLLSVVAGGIWPRTRKELYERSATLLLTEPNEEHTSKSLGQFEAAELLDAAGVASAAMLISGLPGLSLRPNSPKADYRSYRYVPFDDLPKVEAALCRRAFVTVADEQVTYSHRTVAEFLAARWLAKKLQQGLPLGRIQSLLCVKGVPTPELRGLHAWLATLSPEHAPVLIGADPYGVLVYGDAASMSPSLRKGLLQALHRVAESDPWFRADDWTDKPLGGLAGPEMVEDFQSILTDAQSGHHLRSVVLDAIKNGPEVPALRDTLKSIFADSHAAYSERIDAFEALLHVIPGGVNDVISVYRQRLVSDRSTARLRACVLEKLYPASCTTNDIVAVFKDILNDSEGPIGSELWELTSAIPAPYLPEVISALCALNSDEDRHSQRRNNIEVAGAFTHLLERFFVSDLPKQPQQIWTWLCTLYLAKFPSAPLKNLRHLLYATLLEESSWKQLAELAKNVLTVRGRVRGDQRVLWMVTGYLLSPKDFQRILENYLRCRKEALWTVKEFVEQTTSAQASNKLTLTVQQRQFFALLIGRYFVNIYRPIGKAITSDHNNWEAPEFVRWQIEALSGDPSEEAGAALRALEGNTRLTSYRDHLRHAIAKHAKIRRHHHYVQPDWDKTVETLRGGQPANMADLDALTKAHLRTLCSEIRHANIDIYKQFWELSRSGSLQRPRHEDICRDSLIGLLTPRLSPLDIAVEPEGHMAADKRADIVLYDGSGLKLPIEVKRHTHKDLWTACENQLDRLYARDPHATGFGIYLVFWFGEDRGGQVPPPPQGVARPNCALALEQALRARIPADKAYCLDVIVLDVTPPAATTKTQAKSGCHK